MNYSKNGQRKKMKPQLIYTNDNGDELAEENEKLKNKLLLLEKLNQDAFARLLEATNAISYYEQAMKVERYNVWK